MGAGRQVQQMHGGGRARFGRGVLALDLAVATSRARLELLALDAGSGAGLAGVGDPSGAGGRVDTPPLGAVVVVIVVRPMPLEQIGPGKGFPTLVNSR